jgi:recombination protein RecR
VDIYPVAVSRVLNSFKRLPGIGLKSAERLTFALLRRNREEGRQLASAIVEMLETVAWCKVCRNYSDSEICSVCSSNVRDKQVVCVVEQPEDVYSIEKIGEFKGLYYVLHGSISPLDGIGPEELGLEQLVKQVKDNGVKEVIIATNPNVAGEATGLYIARLLEETNTSVSRIALGIPAGGNIGYADEITMLKALEGRTRIILD